MAISKTIKCVDDLIDSIQNIGIEKGQLIFRGHVDSEWELIPALLRLEENKAIALETSYLEPLMAGIRLPYMNTNDPIVFMMNLQHFGIPTRLLDWTFDPLIALFFSCYDKNNNYSDCDGKLCYVDKFLYHRFKINNIENNQYKQTITIENFKTFNDRLNTYLNKIHIIEPFIKNPRMRVQDGCFMFFPIIQLDGKFITLLRFNSARNKWLRENTDEGDKYWIAHKIVEKEFKKSILNELDYKYGISEETIFVESKYMESYEKEYQDIYNKAQIRALTLEVIRKNKLNNKS